MFCDLFGHLIASLVIAAYYTDITLQIDIFDYQLKIQKKGQF